MPLISQEVISESTQQNVQVYPEPQEDGQEYKLPTQPVELPIIKPIKQTPPSIKKPKLEPIRKQVIKKSTPAPIPLIYVPTPVQDLPNCYDIQEVEIIPYMYHYIRQSHRDPTNSGIRNNSITPSSAREQFAYLSDMQNNSDTGIIFMSELNAYKENNCFPHRKNVILVFDDGRRDNYMFLLPLAQEFEIKMNL